MQQLSQQLSPFISGLQNITLIVDQKAQNVAGGTFTMGAWQIRDLNTILFGASNIVKLDTNEFTLLDNNYLIWGYAPANFVNSHQARIFNKDTGVPVSNGISANSSATGGSITCSFFSTFFAAPGAQQTLRIEHQCSTTKATNGFGEVGFQPSGGEQYTAVWLARIV